MAFWEKFRKEPEVRVSANRHESPPRAKSPKEDILASVQENITISQNGNYVLDLILFPDIEEGIEDPGIDVNGDIAEENGNRNIILLIGFLILLVSGIIAGVVYYSRTRSHEKLKPEGTKRLQGLG